MCDERDLCQMFDYLHLLEGLEQSATVTDCSMIQAIRIASWSGMKGMRLAATSSVPVVAYVARGTAPRSHNSLLTEHLVQSSAGHRRRPSR